MSTSFWKHEKKLIRFMFGCKQPQMENVLKLFRSICNWTIEQSVMNTFVAENI